MMESVHVVPEGSRPASDQRVGPTPQKKSHLPDWVSVDGLGSWDQLVEEVQVWPTVVQHVDAGQVLLVRRPVLLVVVEGVGAEFESLVRQIDDSLANVDWSEVPTEKLVALLRRFAWAEAGVRCLAELSPKDSPQDEVEQFYDMLLIRGVLEEAGGQLRDGEDALDLARFAAIGHLAIRHVARELA